MCLMKALYFFITVQIMIIIFYYKRITKKVWRQFECLGENTEKYKTFLVPIENEVTNIDKDAIESVVTISCNSYW